MTRVKICGLRDPADAQVAIDAGADLLGVVFAESPRRATLEQARALRSVTGPRIELFEADTPSFDAAIDRAGRPLLVGVFAGQSADEINRIVSAVDLDVVQLSGGEHPALVGRLTRPVIRVHHVAANEPEVVPESVVAQLTTRVAEQPSTIAALETQSEQGGGSGQTFDWSIAAAVAKEHAIMLGGGLNPENVVRAIEAVGPWAVDVSSGVEVEKGIKDADKIRAFVASSRSASSVSFGLGQADTGRSGTGERV